METLDLPSLAARVQHYRVQCGLSQRELERLCQLPHPVIRRIERGTLCPRVDVLQRLATVLGVGVCMLLVPCTHPPPQEAVLCRDD